ncbi:MAG: hypothetical protein L0H55_16345 [Candidatus Nitrosocosmicus sp.]|nr:hypothetical protein [Candidatus Nitrosocosmicus sp.]
MNNNSNLFLPELLVEKRSGNTEKFNTEKLLKGISRAGTPFLIAKDVSESLTNKLKDNPPIDNLIYSSKIREYVTEELKRRNQITVAESYSGYSKNKVTSLNEEHIKNEKYDSKVPPSINTHSKQNVKDKDIKPGI